MTMAVLNDHGAGSVNTSVVLIRPSSRWPRLNLAELWRYHELMWFLAWRNVKVRYKQTAIGALWAILQPLLAMVVFSVFFGRLAGLPSDGVPYPLFVYCALLPWQLFANSLNEAAASVVADERLVTKVYFPRLVIPISAVSASLVDFLVAGSLLVAMLAWYDIGLNVRVAAVPLFVVMALGAALGVGLWLSALNVQFRDVRYTLPFVTQFWLFASPVAYSSSLVPDAWRWLYGVNPLAGVIEGFRWALLGTPMSLSLVAVSWAVIAGMVLTGLYYFRRMERSFADVL